MRVIFHIGRQKSGTTSIQNWLRDSHQDFSKQGILYPRMGRKNKLAHHELALALNPKSQNFDNSNHLAKILKQEIYAHDTIILSSEAFQNITDTSRIRNFIEILSPSSVEVVCYIREHLDYAVSSYRQKIHAQTEAIEFPKYVLRFRDQSKFFQRWRNIGELHAQWYDRDNFIDGDVIKDFCQRIKIDSKNHFGLDMNPSIGGNLLAFKLAANELRIQELSYNKLSNLALSRADFRMPFFISNESANTIRLSSVYNQSVTENIGPPKMKLFDKYNEVPLSSALMEDLFIICQNLNIKLTNELINFAKKTCKFFYN